MTNTFNPMTAPLAEVIDWLAERLGYYRENFHGEVVWRDKNGRPVGQPKITLDRVAGMLPERWILRDVYDTRLNLLMAGTPGIVAVLRRPDSEETLSAFGPTEFEARARVVAAALMRQ